MVFCYLKKNQTASPPYFIWIVTQKCHMVAVYQLNRHAWKGEFKHHCLLCLITVIRVEFFKVNYLYFG